MGHPVQRYYLLRYLAICHPLHTIARSDMEQAKKIIIFIWAISFMSASPWAFFTKVNYLTYEGEILEESSWCSIPFTESSSGSLYMMLCSTILYFLLPLAIVIVLYSRIGITLHTHKIRRCAASGQGAQCQAERLVVSKGGQTGK